jgi:hypothetical protein
MYIGIGGLMRCGGAPAYALTGEGGRAFQFWRDTIK